MRFISKERVAPPIFNSAIEGVVDYTALYNNQKQPLLNILIDEQKGLCAYCNQKITSATATVEHLICQSHNTAYDLNYHNLFAVCKGNQGVLDQTHCDKFRGTSSVINEYFFPFILFQHCITTSWNDTNPFFDAEYNPRTGVLSGKIVAKQTNVKGYPSINSRIEHAIRSLNLNAPILVEARKEKWRNVLELRLQRGFSWEETFDYYLNLNPSTDFLEFVLLAIRKQ